jgi:hypothetical protein
MLETIKTVGAFAGLLTTAFVIWDRWARGRPLAWVTIKKFGVNPYTYIRIKNPGPADVFILAVRAYPSGTYFIARDQSSQAIVDASLKIDTNVLLWQGETRDLPILPFRKPSEMAKDAPQAVRVVIYWRKTSSSWLPQVPVMIITSTADIERMAKAAIAQKDE